MMVVCEDDKHLKSTFFLDLGHLMQSTNAIPIHILYHSEHYYHSLYIQVYKDTYVSKKLRKRKITHKLIQQSIEWMYTTHSIPGRKNILYYGGHSNWLFQDFKTSLKTNIFERIADVELLILDSCYTSYTNLLSTLIGKTKYVLACSTAGPNLGFLDKRFIETLNKDHVKDVTKYKKIIDLFIQRNSKENPTYRTFHYRTDASLIDMTAYVEVYHYIHHHKPLKQSKCKIENDTYYYFYDLLCLTDDPYYVKKIKQCILYFRANELAISHFKKRGIELGGLIIGIP